MKISFQRAAMRRVGTVVAFAGSGPALSAAGGKLDRELSGRVNAAMKAAGYEGKRESVLDILAPGGRYDRVIIVGIGDPAKLVQREAELLGGGMAGALLAAKVKSAAIAGDRPSGMTLSPEVWAAALASGAQLRHYAFDSYKTKKQEPKRLLDELIIHTPSADRAKSVFAPLEAVREGVHFARNLVNEPANILVPVEFAARCRQLTRSGVKVEILLPAQMKRLGMGALLGVAQGSPNPARLVVMRWNGGRRGETPVAFIGKGVTFDTGGVSIKPAAGMEDMKGDMAGAACVTGLMMALAKRKAKVNAIGAIGLVENSVDGNAQRPGDVVKSMSGQTIAVLNTDAEGRLVLADVLTYVQQRFKPGFMVNLATLTGAIVGALGKEHAGLFSNNDELSERLLASGLATGEKVWRMPLTAEYDKLIDHDVADMKNIGGRYAGAITAAQFLQRFVKDVPWAHLDIAGTAIDSVKSPINQSWASGWGVRLLNRLVSEHYER
jgi:leucyl aminopeptidase